MTKVSFRTILSVTHVATFIFYVVVSFSFAKPVFALEDCTEEKLRSLGVAIVNCSGSNSCVAPTATTAINPLPRGSNVYVLGDSLTVGMRDAGNLEEKMVTEGWAVQKINAVGGEDLDWGNDQIVADSALITNSDAVVVGLGTNNVGTVMDGESNLRENGPQAIRDLITTLVASIKSYNTTAKIYWTSVYVTGTLNTRYGSFDLDSARPVINEAIDSIAAEYNMTILPWGTSVEAQELISTDGIHPSGKYPQMANYIVGQLGGSASVNPAAPAPSLSGCSCSLTNPASVLGSKEERYQQAWNYFVTNKSLSPEAAAGIMGNLEAESGINPHNTQNNAKDSNGNEVPDGPEIPIDLIRSSYGYGIAQWTSAGRQQGLVDFARETNRSTGDMGLQLDFIWKELSESYTSVLAVLQAPNVTTAGASDEFVERFETPEPFLPPPRGSEAARQRTFTARRALSQAIFDTYSILPAGSSGGSACASAGGGAVVIDLETVDTSAIPCAPGTTDDGIVDAYNSGAEFVIRICRVGGTTVNSQLSGPMKNMFDAAAANGVALGGGSGFRDMDGQIGIYNGWCGRSGIDPTPPPYPKAKYSDNTQCPGGAPPGYSNHQMGLAIDMTCNGTLITQDYATAQNNPCFIWLTLNGANYGLFEFGKGAERDATGYEAWHWSVDGT